MDFPTETTLPKDPMMNYFAKEKAALDEAVKNGGLKTEKALNGTMYVLPLPTGNYTVAVSIDDMIIRSGDEIEMRRGTATPGNEAVGRTQVSDFYIDHQGNGEIEYRNSSLPPMSGPLRLHDTKMNISAIVRQQDQARAVKPYL